VAQRHLASQPPSGQLQPGQRVNRVHIRNDQAANVADDHLAVADLQQRAETLTQPEDVGASNPTVDDHDDPARRGNRTRCGH
jgi:hypothetical protein